jgi:DNA polymerase III delta prime subunit
VAEFDNTDRAATASMGAVLVETMLQSENDTPQPKKLHPFFAKGPPENASPLPQVTPAEIGPEDSALIESDTPNSSSKKRRKDCSVADQDAQAPKKQRQKRKGTGASLDGNISTHLKRTSLQEPASHPLQPVSSDIPTPLLGDKAVTPSKSTSQVQQPVESLLEMNKDVKTQNTPRKPPSKVLTFDPKTGTFGLPPKRKEDSRISHIVTIQYGRDDAHREELGSRIAQILADKSTAKRPYQRKSRAPGPSVEADKSGAKPLQSFFTTKTKDAEAGSSPDTSRPKSPTQRRNTVFMSTPVSPRKARDPYPITKKTVNWGSVKPVGTKVPGAMHPAWPSQDTAHVRGDLRLHGPVESPPADRKWTSRKDKGQITTLAAEESVLGHVSRRLDLASIYDTLVHDDNRVEPAPEELRQPQRVFESGRKLRKRITKQLHSRARLVIDCDGSEDELGIPAIDGAHPAILRQFKGLETSLSAFDRSTCEASLWIHKYAPATANQVLQAGKEALLLKEWLEALQVQSVDKGATEGNAKAKGKADKGPKKKRKKKLDNFIVESDDSEEMGEVSENEEDWEQTGPGFHKKSFVRRIPTKDPSRLANSVIVSGPHGCGKTAAVYAVAKELDFEVFEINSSSRRSGKDILEKVGDMTRNHLVQRHQAEAITKEIEDEDETTKDIQSGKQGMMTAFFKPKVAPVLKKPKGSKETGPSKGEAKPVAKSQKQSLILLEEVDVLYDEDKQFWATLLGLMAQSKRPFVMTCTDERLVPIQSLHLHGILRFSPPPVNLAVDTCLLMAANEGHALQRCAVESLYVSRGYDLRAAVMELNYWCQIGVGDRRGGFDWFYLRWPKGSDRDEDGDVVRVISTDTYKTGMGWIGRDLLLTSSDTLEKEEEAMRQCWDSWRAPLGDWHSSLDLTSCVAGLSDSTPSQAQFPTLAAYQELCESLSDYDIFSGGVFGTEPQQDLIDPTAPDLTTKTKEDFIVGQQLLEAPTQEVYSNISGDISSAVSSLARQDLLGYASRLGSTDACLILSPVGEEKSISILNTRFHGPAVKYVTRHDLSFAFDPIAASEAGAQTASLDPSVFDRTMKVIICDVAPWVRSIVSYDQSLMLERRKLSNLLSEGGQRKRMRNTRSAYSALEGGERKSTRRENYFRGDINPKVILDTGLRSWRDAARVEGSAATTEEAQSRASLGSDSAEDTEPGSSP